MTICGRPASADHSARPLPAPVVPSRWVCCQQVASAARMATVTHHETRRAARDTTVAVQRLDALERATAVRVLRGALKVDVKEGRVAI